MNPTDPVPTELALARGGISYRQYDHWNRRGWLPWGTPGSGNARPHRISADDAAFLITMGRLVSQGLTPQAAARVARDLAQTGTARLGEWTLVNGEAS